MAKKRSEIRDEDLTSKKDAFLKAMAECGDVRHSASCAGINRRRVYEWRETDEDFAKDWDAAIEDVCDQAEAEVIRRGVKGILKPVFHLGKKVASVREFSDTLLMFYLNGRRSEVFARTRHIHSGSLTLTLDQIKALPVGALSDEDLANIRAGNLTDELIARLQESARPATAPSGN